MFTIRWNIKTIDRISMIEDVLKEFSLYNINIISMKVTAGRILIKSMCRHTGNINSLVNRLNNHHDIINVEHFNTDSEITSPVSAKQSEYFTDMIGESQQMQSLIEKAIKFSESRFTVLIRGETGTGKELLARAIHNCGSRRLHAFIPVNCSTIPED